MKKRRPVLLCRSVFSFHKLYKRLSYLDFSNLDQRSKAPNGSADWKVIFLNYNEWMCLYYKKRTQPSLDYP